MYTRCVQDCSHYFPQFSRSLLFFADRSSHIAARSSIERLASCRADAFESISDARQRQRPASATIGAFHGRIGPLLATPRGHGGRRTETERGISASPPSSALHFLETLEYHYRKYELNFRVYPTKNDQKQTVDIFHYPCLTMCRQKFGESRPASHGASSSPAPRQPVRALNSRYRFASRLSPSRIARRVSPCVCGQ